MNILLWTVQIVIALAFASAAFAKLVRPRQQLRAEMTWVDNVPPGAITALGVVEGLLAVGLVLPGVTGTATVLTPVAALAVIVVMVGSVLLHTLTRQYLAVVLSLLVLGVASLVVWGRLGPYPL